MSGGGGGWRGEGTEGPGTLLLHLRKRGSGDTPGQQPGAGLQTVPALLSSAPSTTPVFSLRGGPSEGSSICPSLCSRSRLWPQHFRSYTHPGILSGPPGCIFSDVNLSNLSKTQNRPCLKWSESHSVVSDSLQPHGLYSSWNSPGQNTGVGSLSLLQEIFPTQGSNSGLLHCRWILYQLSHKGRGRIRWAGSRAQFLLRLMFSFKN